MATIIITKWTLSVLIIFLLLCLVKKSDSTQLDPLNSPPIMYIDRNWRILPNEPVGSVVTRVRADDTENDRLQFGFEPLTYVNFGGDKQNDYSLPFRIDPDTGVVYLNESLVNRAGQNFFLYVTVTDGKLVAKNEVYVNILNSNSTKGSDLYGARPPTFTPNTNNVRQFLPQLLNGQLNNGGISGINLPPPPQLPNTNTNINTNNNGYRPSVQKNTYVETNETRNTNNKQDGTRVVNYQTTKLVPVVNGGNSNGNSDNINTQFINNNNNNLQNSTINNNKNNNNNNNNLNETTKKEEITITNTAVLPIIITICGIFLIAILIAIFMFRKYLCTISKFLKKKSKEEMAKKSNLNTITGGLQEDSQNSIGMQHWNGPIAYNNRYVPTWERENQHMQVTSHLSTNSSANSQSNLKINIWDFPRHRLKFFNILGEGAFGQVWRCEASNIDGYEGIQTVAVKTLKENATESEKTDLLSELQVMKRLEPHVNVVRLLGSCVEKEPIFVILEYVNKGKLQSYLRSSRAEKHYGNMHGKSNTLTSGDLTAFMYQVARGMDFLTSRGIIHRDLAARNILITEDHTCKVADFGFARDVVTSKIYERKSEGRLPIRWMAIESLYDNIFSVKSDIWSFGVLMWEIVTLGSTPYPGITAADVMKKVRDGYRLEKPEHCRRELYNIMYYCWEKDANVRPNFAEVVNLLDKLLLTETEYIELERFPDHNYYNMSSLSGEKL